MSNPPLASYPKRHKNPHIALLASGLAAYDAQVRPLPGIQNPAARDCLVKQLIDSIRRVEYVKRLTAVRHDPAVADPGRDRFNPLRAAAFRSSEGRADDAVWLVFLAVHFGKHGKDGWALSRHVYGRPGEPGVWDWPSVSADPSDFRRWLATQYATLAGLRFSNHRKYQSLAAFSHAGTGAAVESFVDWVASAGSLDALVRAAHRQVGQNPAAVFDALYRDMKRVRQFGRLAKFDFLTLLGKLGLAPILPGSAYVWDGASGPYLGIRLLVTGDRNGSMTRKAADAIYVDLGQALNVGMQELEDALCNWQKSPTRYRFFKG